MITAFKRHPLSALFSQFDLGDADIAALSADIKENGQHVPIAIFDGLILDGWNRYRACFLANIEPITEELPDGRDAWAFVCSVNMHRRSLTPKQKAAIYLLHEDFIKGDDVQNCTPTVRDIVEQFDVSHGTAQNLAKIARDGSAELKASVTSGQVSISNAAAIAKLPKDQQPAAIMPQQKSAPPPAIETENALDDFDPVQELEQLQSRFDALETRANALLADDHAKELDKYIAMANGLQSRLNQELVKNSEMDKNLRRIGKQIAEIRKALGTDDDREILGIIKQLKAK